MFPFIYIFQNLANTAIALAGSAAELLKNGISGPVEFSPSDSALDRVVGFDVERALRSVGLGYEFINVHAAAGFTDR